jgi:hypothetical protein
MAEGRLPKGALKWMPKQKTARRRPKKNWMEEIKKAMNERNLREGQWEDRKTWNLGVGQRRKSFETDIHTYNIKQSPYRPGLLEFEAPRFQDNRRMIVVSWSAVGYGHLYLLENITGTHFC